MQYEVRKVRSGRLLTVQKIRAPTNCDGRKPGGDASFAPVVAFFVLLFGSVSVPFPDKASKVADVNRRFLQPSASRLFHSAL